MAGDIFAVVSSAYPIVLLGLTLLTCDAAKLLSHGRVVGCSDSYVDRMGMEQKVCVRAVGLEPLASRFGADV